MLFFLGISISLFLTILLLLKKNKTKSEYILNSWMFVISLHQIFFYLDYTKLSYSYPHFLGLGLPFPVLHSSFLFLYVSEVTKNGLNDIKKIILTFTPFMLLLVVSMPFYTLSSEQKLEVFVNDGKGFEWYSIIKNITIVAVGLFFTSRSLIMIRSHKKNIQNLFSNTDKKNLDWLKYLSFALGIIWVLVIFFDDEIIFSGVVALVLFIGFFGINQLDIFTTKANLDHVNYKKDYVRYAKSGLKNENAIIAHENLSHLMRKEKLFTKSDLSLIQLSEQLEINSNYLSQIINEKENKNFNQYINTLRVQEFMSRLSNKEHEKLTLLSIAYDCGFNSKSTFNKYFKAHTGKTPTEYLNSIKDSL